MRSISSVGVKSVRRSFSRYLLTALGASLGVAVMFGVLATNASVSAGLDRALGSNRVPTVWVSPIGSYGNTLPAAMVQQAAALPGVGFASGSVFIPTTVTGSDQELGIVGNSAERGVAAAEASQRWDTNATFEGRLPAPGANEISLSRPRAASLGVGLGDILDVTTRNGPAQFTVVRVIDWPDNNGLVSLATAQRLLGRGDVVQSINLQLADGTDLQRWIEQHSPAFGSGARLQSGGGDDLRGAVGVIQNGFAALALLATFVGGFLIYLTLSTSVTERSRTWGVLRAIGANRRDVVRAVLTEALALGAVATVAGIAIGAVLGRGLLRFSASLYDMPSVSFIITGRTVAFAVLLGMVTPPAAALVPAWRAARAEPVDAMRDRHVDASTLGRAWIAGASMLALGSFMHLRGSASSALRLAPVIFMLGAVLVVPVVLAPIARAVGSVIARLVPGLGDAAVHHLVKERRRSAYTLGLVMVVLGMVLALGGMQSSILAAIDEGFRVRYAADVSVWAWDGMAPEVAEGLRGIDTVAKSTEFRSGRVTVAAPRAAEGELLAIEPASFFDLQGFPWADGDDASAERALTDGGGVLLPQAYAERAGLERGDHVALHTTEGARTFTVAGVFSTPERGLRVVVGRADGERWFATGSPQGFELAAVDGVSPELLRERVEEVVRDRPGYFVNTTSGEQAAAAAQIRSYFRPFLAVILLAGVVGALGLANTLGMAVLRRTREIGVLRAVGIDRRALGGMVLVEALTMGAVAFVLSLPLGWVMSSALLASSSGELGFIVDLVTPWRMLPVLAAGVVVICGAAAFGPARKVARLDPVAALRFE